MHDPSFCLWAQLSICSLGLRGPWRFWGRKLGRGSFLFPFLFLRRIWEISRRLCSLESHWLFKVLRGPCWKRIRIWTSVVIDRCCCEIRVCLEFIHPTGSNARRGIQTDVCHMFNIRRVTNFDLSLLLLHNKDFGNEFQTFVYSFDLGSHDYGLGRNRREQPLLLQRRIECFEGNSSR